MSMSRSRFWLLLLLFVAAVHAHASIAIPIGVEAQVDEADLIFVGTVAGTRAVPVKDGSFAFTYVTFHVEETLKGAASGPLLTLRVAGGQVGRHVYGIAGGPRFEKGGRHLLFVLGNDRHAIPLSGGSQGKLDLVTHPVTQETIVVDDGRRVVEGVGGKQWTRRGLEVDEYGRLQQPPPAATVLSEEGMKVVLDQPPTSEEAAPASKVIAELRALIRSRAFAPEFRRSAPVQSASPASAAQ